MHNYLVIPHTIIFVVLFRLFLCCFCRAHYQCLQLPFELSFQAEFCEQGFERINIFLLILLISNGSWTFWYIKNEKPLLYPSYINQHFALRKPFRSAKCLLCFWSKSWWSFLNYVNMAFWDFNENLLESSQ